MSCSQFIIKKMKRASNIIQLLFALVRVEKTALILKKSQGSDGKLLEILDR